MADWHYVETAGVPVPLQAFKATTEHAVLMMMPALGVPARFYQRLAAGLCDQGFTTYVFEQRGHGQSAVRPSRQTDFGFAEYLEVDIPAALGFIRTRHPNAELYVGGHSLGGHMASMTVGLRGDDIAGVFHMACGFPYAGFYDGKEGTQVKVLAMLIPFMLPLFGYYPGEKLGFGGCEFRQLMRDWRHWAKHGEYDFPGLEGVAERMATYRGRFLSITYDKDSFVSEQALAFSRAALPQADAEYLSLGAAEQGEFLGHFNWAKGPEGTIEALESWIRA